MGANVTFYAVQPSGLFPWVAKLVARAFERKRQVLVLCENETQSRELDEFLWTFDEESFIPHKTVPGPPKEEGVDVPVLLSTEPVLPPTQHILIQLGVAEPDFALNFEHVIEIVDRTDEAKLIRSRERYRTWKGFEEQHGVQVVFKG